MQQPGNTILSGSVIATEGQDLSKAVSIEQSSKTNGPMTDLSESRNIPVEQTTEPAQIASKQAEPITTPAAPTRLAPAPLPQENPWGKSKNIEAARPPAMATEVPLLTPKVAAANAAAAVKQAGQRRDENKESSAKARSTGKEKWVPYTPVVLTTPPSGNNNNSTRSKQKTRAKTQGKRSASSNHHHSGSRDSQSSHARGSQNNNQPGSSSSGRDSNHKTEPGERSGSTNAQSGQYSHNRRGSDLNPRGHSPGYRGGQQQSKGSSNVPGERMASNSDHSEQRQHTGPKKKRDQDRSVVQPLVHQQMYGNMPMHFMVSPYETAIALVSKQIAYYFSTENLCKDMYLRRQMNSNGLIPIEVIANFNRIKALTDGNTELVVEALYRSNVTEIIGNKVRCREDWERWILNPDDRFGPGKNEEDGAPVFQLDSAKVFVPSSKMA